RDVMIEVDTAGVGTWEPEQRSGTWPVEDASYPLVLGSDGSGIVVARGARARRFRVGDRVYAFNLGNGNTTGFDAEHVAVPQPTGAAHKYFAVPEPSVARIPKGIDLLHAGASPSVALTAIQGIDDALHLKR